MDNLGRLNNARHEILTTTKKGEIVSKKNPRALIEGNLHVNHTKTNFSIFQNYTHMKIRRMI
jgi:hypothetical protein